MDKLKLIAFDAEDLAVVSAHLQDAVLKTGDLTFLPREQRFVALVRRFDWAAGAAAARPMHLRRQSAVRFERVRGAKRMGLDPAVPGKVLSLLAVQFEPASADDPAGTVTLTFAGGGAIRLEVECLEVELRDLGPVWRARSRPEHPKDGSSGSSGA